MTDIWRGAAVITGRRLPEGLEVLRDAGIAAADGRVVGVGPVAELSSRFPQARVTDLGSALLMPGFVDGHHHQGLTPIRRGARAMSLEHVFTYRRGLRGPELYDDTLYGALTLLRNGITTVNHLHVGRAGPWERWRQDADEVLAAYREAGLRVNFTFNFRDQNRLLYDGDDWFARTLPADLGEPMAAFLDGQQIPLAAYLDELFTGLWCDKGSNTGPEARISLAPHNLHWCTDESIVAIADVARRHDVHVNMHLLESPRQELYARRRAGTTAIAHLDDLGVLDRSWTLLHAVRASSHDIERLATAQTRVCSSIGSNLLMGSGVAPLAQMRDRGVPLSVGLDEGGMDGRSDVFSDLRLTQGVHQIPDRPSPTFTGDELFAMATSGAAASTEFREDVGVLEPGRYADFVIVDWGAVNDPGGEHGPTPVDDLVAKASSEHIRGVVVGGRQVVRDGVHQTLDEGDLLRRLRMQMQSPETVGPAREHRELLRQVRPYVERYWAEYGHADADVPASACSHPGRSR